MSSEIKEAITLSSLSYRYPKTDTDTLRIPEWRVSVGEKLFLQGASGSGKSTLLQLLCGLKAGQGELRILGEAIDQFSQAKRDQFRANHIGMVFQQFNLIPYLSALDNVLLAASLATKAQKHGSLKLRAQALLDQVGITKVDQAKTANTLSIGQQQRVAIARAMINSPEILLFDEPTSALDETNQVLFMDALNHYLDTQLNTTVIFVSHDARLKSYFEHAVLLSDISEVSG